MGLLYDRKLDNGNGQVKETDIPLDGSKVHITQYDAQNNTRHSWDTDGKSADSASNMHSTDQNCSKGSSGRHK